MEPIPPERIETPRSQQLITLEEKLSAYKEAKTALYGAIYKKELSLAEQRELMPAVKTILFSASYLLTETESLMTDQDAEDNVKLDEYFRNYQPTSGKEEELFKKTREFEKLCYPYVNNWNPKPALSGFESLDFKWKQE